MAKGFYAKESIANSLWPLKYFIICSGNGLMPVRHQAITWTNADMLSLDLFVTKYIFISIKT